GSQAVLFLFLYSLCEFIQGKAGKVVIQGLERIVGQSCADGLPRQRVVAHDCALRHVFNLARLGIFHIELHRRFAVGENPLEQRHGARNHERCAGSENQYAYKLHCLPPTCSSFPSTTPAATVIVALSDAGSSARAMSFLMRASTVLLPVLSVWIKVTIVPSGTGLPLQSRIGSVSTIVFWAVGRPRACGNCAHRDQPQPVGQRALLRCRR